MRFKNPINCDNIPVDVFFPEKGINQFATKGNYAKRICNNCLAKEECLEYALSHSVMGIWGGTTENERRKLRRKLKILAVPVLPPTGAIVL